MLRRPIPVPAIQHERSAVQAVDTHPAVVREFVPEEAADLGQGSGAVKPRKDRVNLEQRRRDLAFSDRRRLPPRGPRGSGRRRRGGDFPPGRNDRSRRLNSRGVSATSFPDSRRTGLSHLGTLRGFGRGRPDKVGAWRRGESLDGREPAARRAADRPAFARDQVAAVGAGCRFRAEERKAIEAGSASSILGENDQFLTAEGAPGRPFLLSRKRPLIGKDQHDVGSTVRSYLRTCKSAGPTGACAPVEPPYGSRQWARVAATRKSATVNPRRTSQSTAECVAESGTSPLAA